MLREMALSYSDFSNLLAFYRVVLQDEIDPASVPTSQKNVIGLDPKQVRRKALAHSKPGEVGSGVFKRLD
jgi:hypothetical protein